MVGSLRNPVKYTYDDLLTFPDDGLRREIIDGELYVTPSPATQHQVIVGNVYYLLRRHLAAHPAGHIFLAPLDVVFSKFDVVEPDLLFVSNARRGVVTRKNIQGSPDLAIEVLSPSDSVRKVRSKVADWLSCGSAAALVLDPRRKVAELHRAGRVHVYAPPEVLMLDDVLPGWSLDLVDLFR